MRMTLEEARRLAGYSVGALEREAGVKRGTVGAIEAGVRTPSADEAARLAAALVIEVEAIDELLGIKRRRRAA